MTDAAATRLLTADDLLDLPDDGQQHELVRGMLVTMSAAAWNSSRFAVRAGWRIAAFVEEHDLGDTCGADCGFRLFQNPDTVQAPDFAFVRKARLALDGGPRRGYWEGAPDLAVEVLSPNDRFSELMEKVEEYLLAGTGLVWVFDPERRATRIFRSDGTNARLPEDGILDGEEVLPGFQLDLTMVWK